MVNKQEHAAYIASGAWQRRRARYFTAHRRQCRVCGTASDVALHHVSYAKAGAGREPDRDLVPLCRGHHTLAHDYEHSGRYGQMFGSRTLRRATNAMITDQCAGRRPVLRAPRVPRKVVWRRGRRRHAGLKLLVVVVVFAAWGELHGWWGPNMWLGFAP